MTNSEIPESNFNPKVLVFFCDHCCGASSSADKLSLAHISDSITSVHFSCAREVTPQDIRRGFADGAEGILICGCLVRDCANSPGDLDVLRSLYQNQLTVKKLGLVADRLREEWVVQGTTDHLEHIIEKFVIQLRTLGPIEAAAKTRESRA